MIVERIEKTFGIEEWFQNIGSSRSNMIFFVILALISTYLILSFPPRYAFFLIVTILYVIFIVLYPFVGVYAYYVIEIIAPQSFIWKGTGSLQMALIVALFTGVAGLMFIARTKLKFVFTKQSYIILCFWASLFITYFFAQYKDLAWEKFVDYYSKFFIFFFISTNLIRTKGQFLSVIGTFTSIFALFGVRGVKAYIGGARRYTGIGGKLGVDNNLFGMALVMGVPFVFYPFLMKKSVSLWKKICILIFVPTVIMSIICTHSRGAFIGVVGVLFFIILRIKRKLISLLLLLLLPFLTFILPPEYKERIKTIQSYEEDASSMARIEAWQAGFRIIRDYPLTGLGLDNYRYFVQGYNPDAIYLDKIVAHNAYIELAAEAGLITFFFYALLIITSLLDLYKLRKKNINDKENYWVIPITYLLECSLWGYLICSMFGSTETFEVLYFLCGMIVMLKKVAEKS